MGEIGNIPETQITWGYQIPCALKERKREGGEKKRKRGTMREFPNAKLAPGPTQTVCEGTLKLLKE